MNKVLNSNQLLICKLLKRIRI